jgi:biotin-(acetyl-CoA carboxylase) ligase
MNKKSVAKFLTGVGLGVGIGMLFSPKSGKENRQELKKMLDEIVEKAKRIDPEEIRNQVIDKVNEIKKELEELDKEKVLSIAKKKGEQLKNKAEDLVKYAKEKGTPIIEGIAEDARKKTISVVAEVLERLEKAE